VALLPSGTAAAPAVHVERFVLDRHPVTNAEYLAFTLNRPQWRRGRIPKLFADGDYLSHWVRADALGTSVQPVTRVSWFAARAY
jgi:formylglycine-generating enzyme required for sulfatase activity